MRKAIPALLLCLFASACLGGGAADRLTFREAGFSIESLAGGRSLLMALPVSHAFAPNVNVQIQPYSGALEEYVALSKQQFEEAGLELIKEARKGKAGWVVEYRGTMADRDLHWYAKAELSRENAYLATATALESQWPSASEKLRACVDSLQSVP